MKEEMGEEEMQRPIKAFLVFALFFALTVALVIAAVFTILTWYPQADFLFHGTALYSVILGTPFSISAGFTAYYSKGRKQRLMAALLTVSFGILYFIHLLSSLNIGWRSEEWAYQLSIPAILVMVVVAFLLHGLYFLYEYLLKNEDGSEKEDEEEERDKSGTDVPTV